MFNVIHIFPTSSKFIKSRISISAIPNVYLIRRLSVRDLLEQSYCLLTVAQHDVSSLPRSAYSTEINGGSGLCRMKVHVRDSMGDEGIEIN